VFYALEYTPFFVIVSDYFNLGTKPDIMAEIVDILGTKSLQWSQIILIWGLNLTQWQKLSTILGLVGNNDLRLFQSVIIVEV
jgi:hypothetical protein